MIFNTANVAGGGSSSGASLFVVNIASYDSGRMLVCDKTVGEILDAFYAGKSIWFKTQASEADYYDSPERIYYYSDYEQFSITVHDLTYQANGVDSYPTYNSGGGGGAG